MLYQWEVGRLSMFEVRQTFWTHSQDRGDRLPEDLRQFATSLADGVAAHVEALDPLIAASGGKQALLAQPKEFDGGSDHVVLTDSAFRIPTIYMNDWPDRYIHTTGDVPANIDATKLERVAFIGAASGWFLANLAAADLPALTALLEREGALKGTARR